MNTNILKFFLIIISFSFLTFNISTVQAADNKQVILVYASWSSVSRDLRPIASSIAHSFNVSYTEYDIDSDTTHERLQNMNLNIPDETPFIVVIKNGKTIFKKAYPNSTPDLLKEDLNKVLSN